MSELLKLQDNTLSLLEKALNEKAFGKVAAVSSFGSESSVLLHLISRINKDAPVMFIDTRMLFRETLEYKIALTRHLGLRDVRTISPDNNAIRKNDIWGRLHKENPDACCDLRKTSVLDAALSDYDGWITGRKRFQAATRSQIEEVETAANGKTKLNPLAAWTADDLADYMEWFDLPQHALVNHGYASIGCATCTSPVKPGEDARSGRWRGMDKIECGIHVEDGQIERKSVNEEKRRENA